MANELKFANPIVVGSAASDPATGFNGEIYYNTTLNKFRKYENGAWADLTGNTSLTGNALNTNNIVVGNGSNLSAAVNTNSTGDILADSSTALTIKTGAVTAAKLGTITDGVTLDQLGAGSTLEVKALGISNSHIATAAAIAVSKLAALTADRAVVSNGSGVLAPSAVTATELGYVSGVTSAVQTQLNAKATDSAVIKKDGSVAFTANQPMGGFKLTGLADGTASTDSATKGQMDTANGLKVNKAGDTMSGNLAMGSNKVTGLADGTASTDSATKGQMDTADNLKLNKAGDTMSGNLVMGTNKITGLGAGTAGTDAVNKAQLDAMAAGLVWLDPIDLSNLIGTSTTPIGSPVTPDAYIIGTGGNTGAWSGFAVGDVVQWVTSAWVLIKAAAIGDRFGISFQTATAAVGDAVGKDNYIGEITGGTAGSWTWTWTAPSGAHAVFVDNINAFLFGHSYTYVSSTSSWVEFSGPGATVAGIGLSYSGNTLNVNLGAGIIELPTDEVGVDIHASGGLFTTVDNSAGSTATAAQLAVKLDSSTLSKSSSGLKVAAGGITNTEINASAAIALTKLAAMSIDRVVTSDHTTGALVDTDAANDKFLVAKSLSRGASTSAVVKEEYVDSTTLTDNTAAPATILTFAHATIAGMEIAYVIKTGAGTPDLRIGTLRVVSNGTTTSIVDTFSETADCGVTFSASISAGNTLINYTTTSQGSNRTLRADTKLFRK